MNCNKNGIKREGESCSLNNNCIYPDCMEELELEAEKYENNLKCNSSISFESAIYTKLSDAFIAGATSKYVEKQKLEFAIEQLKKFREATLGRGINTIKELEQKLAEL